MTGQIEKLLESPVLEDIPIGVMLLLDSKEWGEWDLKSYFKTLDKKAKEVEVYYKGFNIVYFEREIGVYSGSIKPIRYYKTFIL